MNNQYLENYKVINVAKDVASRFIDLKEFDINILTNLNNFGVITIYNKNKTSIEKNLQIYNLKTIFGRKLKVEELEDSVKYTIINKE